jgi:hypothetical protein
MATAAAAAAAAAAATATATGPTTSKVRLSMTSRGGTGRPALSSLAPHGEFKKKKKKKKTEKRQMGVCSRKMWQVASISWDGPILQPLLAKIKGVLAMSCP